MDRPSKEPGLRFSLRHLLLAMTAASVLMGLATLLPREVLRFLLRLVDLGLIAGLVAGAMVYSGRLRIVCVAALIPLADALFGRPAVGALFQDFYRFINQSLGYERSIGNVVEFALRWTEALLSGTVAYVVAGWLARKK